jgi:uncharacterized protein (DUF736 family)
MTTETIDLEKKYSELVLKNKKITVTPCDRKNPNMPKGYDGEFMFTGCTRVYRLPRRQNGGYLQFLTNDEIEAYEYLLQYPKGTLSYYKNKDNFWHKFKITVGKDGLVLNQNDPEESLKIRVLMIQSEIAKSWEERLNRPGEYWFAIVDEDVKIKDKLNAGMLKAKAYKLLSKIDNSHEKMLNTLKVLGKRPTPDAKTDWLYSQLVDIIEQVQVAKGVRNIHDFISVREDPNFDMKVFIEEALRANELEKRSTSYYLNGGDKIGGTLDEAVTYFKDKGNSDVYHVIKANLK